LNGHLNHTPRLELHHRTGNSTSQNYSTGEAGPPQNKNPRSPVFLPTVGNPVAPILLKSCGSRTNTSSYTHQPARGGPKASCALNNENHQQVYKNNGWPRLDSILLYMYFKRNRYHAHSVLDVLVSFDHLRTFLTSSINCALLEGSILSSSIERPCGKACKSELESATSESN